MTTNQRNPTWAERLDSAIGFFFPKMGLKRKYERSLLKAQSAYDDVPTWRNSAGWLPLDGSAEALNGPNRDLARRKARHLERNSEIVNSIINAFVRNVVGKGFNLQVRTADENWNNIVEDVWLEFCRPGNCDVTGRLSLNEVLRMIVRRRLVDGAIMAIKVYDDEERIPFKLQMAEVDQLQGPVAIEKNGNPIVGGIEVNSYGKHIAYYVKKTDFNTFAPLEADRIEAQRVLYLMEHTRPSEVREITPLVRTLNEIHDLDEFYEAVLFKHKINAAIAVYITNSDKAVGPVVGNSVVGSITGGVTNKPANGSKAGKRIVPGSVTELKAGQDVRTLVPGGQSSELAAYNLAAMRKISAGHAMSYEMVTRDVSQVNYSSARQNLLEDWKVFAMEQNYLIEHFLDVIFEEVIKSAVLSGRIPEGAYPKDFFKSPGKWLKHEFIGQGLPWIDPYKEAMANKVLLETNQTTLKDLFAKQGKDWETELAQIEKEAEFKAGIANIMQPAEKGEISDGKTDE